MLVLFNGTKKGRNKTLSQGGDGTRYSFNYIKKAGRSLLFNKWNVFFGVFIPLPVDTHHIYERGTLALYNI
jgi:hypothetical protein